MSAQLSVFTESKQYLTAPNPKVDKYCEDDLPPLTPEAVAAVRARVKADAEAARQEHGNRNPEPTKGKGRPRPDAGRRPRRSTQRNNSSPGPSEPKSSNDSTQPERDSSEAIRGRAFTLRTSHRGLVKEHHKALALCGLGTYGEKHERKPQAHLVCDHVAGEAGFRRVAKCRSSWACPVCSAANSAKRTRALKPQVRRHMTRGGTAWLLTLTLRHRLDVPLANSLSGLSRAWSSMTSGEGWKGLLESGDVEWVRGFDVTHGAHGWHPHIHVLVLPGAAWGSGERLAKGILARWRQKLQAAGWDSVEAAQDCRRVDDVEKAAAYAVSPAAVYEPTAMAMKRARKDAGSRTPFEILEGATGISRRDKALWVEYVQAVKGRQQATCSKGLTLDIEKVDDAEDEDGYEPPDIIAGIGREAVNELDRAGMAAPLLDAVEARAGDPDGVREAARELLSRLESRDWRIFGRWEAQEELEDGRQRALDEAETRRLAEEEPDGFRRRLDDIDRAARAIPDSPEEEEAQELRERASARMPRPIGAGGRDPAEMLLPARGRFRKHLTP